MANQDVKEKNRKLSQKEQERLERYEARSRQLEEQGYKRTELTVSIASANVYAFLLGLPFIIPGVALFFIINRGKISFSRMGGVIFVIAFLVLIVVHELIHGVTWSLFAEHHWKDIEFGFMAQYLTPYCTCTCPLSRGHYIIGALMPLILLGLLPIIIAIITGSLMLLVIGVVMVISAGGDIMLVLSALKYKSNAKETLFIDHPTQAGGVVFER